MQRVLILIAVLVGGGFLFESYSGQDLGIRKTMVMTGGAVVGGFAGGYGMATDAGTSIGGSAAGMAKGISNNMGGVFGN